jgi:hypothetical protein
VEIGAGLCGIGLATNEAGILDVLRITPTIGWAILSLRKQCFLFFGAMLENWFDANWTIEINDLLEKGGGVFSIVFQERWLRSFKSSDRD